MPKNAEFSTANFDATGAEQDIGGVLNIVSGGKLQVESGGVIYQSVLTGLTALAGGAQAGTALTGGYNVVSTVATIADSVQLPVSVAGDKRTVTNTAANSCNVFGQTGDTINALSANVAFALASGKTAEFICPAAGKWYAILSA